MDASQLSPFRTKMVEKISLLSPKERKKRIEAAHFNLFKLHAQDIFIDLLTDSGTSAMSDTQWGAMFSGDESYAGSRSFYRFQKVVQDLVGHEYVVPTHQGRGAEHIFFSTVLTAGQIVPNNTHFDTTRANIEKLGACALDLPCLETTETAVPHPFKGNMNLEKLERVLSEEKKGKIPLVMMTITNNASGGQPASLENIKAVKKNC